MNSDNIWDWLEQSTFEELSPDQKVIVEAEMGKEEYDRLHSSVSLFNDVDNAEWPPSSSDTPVVSMERRWWNYKLPLYQWAAASVLLGAIVFTIMESGNAETKDGKVRSSFTLSQDVYPDSLVVEL